MSDEQMRETIREACGWDDSSSELGIEFRESTRGGYVYHKDPLNSLDTMHEAEKVFRGDTRWQAYKSNLWDVCHNPECLPCEDPVHATARQRAQAFIATIGRKEGV